VMLNDLDRFHLVIDVIDRVEGLANRAAVLRQRILDTRLAARRYTREDPDISGWTWDSEHRSNSLSQATLSKNQ
jgi:xylulose-5-phosphate/fructose-6-phosphate phosphoketolase